MTLLVRRPFIGARSLTKKGTHNEERCKDTCAGQTEHFNFRHVTLVLLTGESKINITPYRGRKMAGKNI